jgi:hypothetical protein
MGLDLRLIEKGRIQPRDALACALREGAGRGLTLEAFAASDKGDNGVQPVQPPAPPSPDSPVAPVAPS